MSDNDEPRKLLLIDDDPGEHTLLKAIIAAPPPYKPPIIVLGALSWEGGIAKVHEEMPDVVLLDLKLSEQLRGLATIEAARVELFDIVPTLIVTGHMEPTDDWNLPQLWREARASGACGFLRKDRYFDKANRAFLLHELNDAILEFCVRQSAGLTFNNAEHGPTPQTRTA